MTRKIVAEIEFGFSLKKSCDLMKKLVISWLVNSIGNTSSVAGHLSIALPEIKNTF